MKKMKIFPSEISVGDRIHCANDKELRNMALVLSSKGYGVAVIGLSDIEDHVLTITAGKEQTDAKL